MARKRSRKALRADELFAEHDHDGTAVSHRIIDAVGQLANMTPPGALHGRRKISFRRRIVPAQSPTPAVRLYY
jgi:hypothetical protein